MRQLIGNTILFLLAVMERERKLTPEIEMDAFYNSENYEKNLWISVFNACVEVTELVFFSIQMIILLLKNLLVKEKKLLVNIKIIHDITIL